MESPNYAPFDKASLTAYNFALRGKEFAQNNQAGYDVYFDDIEMGIQNASGGFEPIFNNGFEAQATVNNIPINSIPIALDDLTESLWYLENEDAKLLVTDKVARSGGYSLECKADLQQP